MKITFNKYLSLLLVLLLNTFTSLPVNEVSSNTNYAATQNFSAAQCVAENSSEETIAIATFNPYQKEIESRLFFDFVDNSENEESSIKNSSYYKDDIETAFINAKVFKNSSKQLQKNKYRPQSDISEPTLRLHLQFQVFII